MSTSTTKETGWAIRIVASDGSHLWAGEAWGGAREAIVFTDRSEALRHMTQSDEELVPITRTITVEIGEPEVAK